MILRNLFAGQQWRHRHREESGKEERKRSCSVVSGSLRTPWTVAYQAPPAMGFSRPEYWSGLPFTSLGDLPNPGTEPWSPALRVDALPSEPPGGRIGWDE